MSHVQIDNEKCKGCGICLKFCRRNVLVFSQTPNTAGVFYPIMLEQQVDGERCNGCRNCAIVCPDMCVEVWRTPNAQLRAAG